MGVKLAGQQVSGVGCSHWSECPPRAHAPPGTRTACVGCGARGLGSDFGRADRRLRAASFSRDVRGCEGAVVEAGWGVVHRSQRTCNPSTPARLLSSQRRVLCKRKSADQTAERIV